MRIMNLALFSALTALTVAPACRSDSNNTDGGGGPDARPTDGATNPDGTNQGTVTVKQVQGDTIASGDAIELKGVIVTAIDTYGAKTGDLWVEDVGGGEFSGVKVFGAMTGTVATLQVGDIVDITNAEKYEFACNGMNCGTGTFDPGQSITEVQGITAGALTITKTGHGEVPAPAAVDATAIAAMPKAMQDIEWEKWEGVLIKVTNVPQVTPTKGFNMMPADDQYKFEIPGKVAIESLMTPLPTSAAVDFCYSQITGVGDYFFDHLILPRTAADIGAAGTGCPVREVTSVAAIQMGTATGAVSLQNVFVTGRDDIGTMMNPNGNRGFWVADSLTAAANQGIYVYTNTTAAPAAFVIGAKVSVIGSTTEFDATPPAGDKLTEINSQSVSFVAAPTAPPIPATTASVATLSDIGAAGEPWEGVLVSAALLKVTNINAGSGKVELTDNTGAKLIMDNDSFDFTAQTLNTCYATVTGIMSVQLTDNVRTINPRSATDLVVGTGCN